MPEEIRDKKRRTALFSSLSPPFRLVMFAVFGIIAGLLLVLGNVSRVLSYLSDEPETCVNCHVMNTQYSTWQHSSHGRNTTCNDCHVPHDNIANHYVFKAKDGAKHATVFTLRQEPQVIRLSESAKPVIQDNCIRCHTHQVERVDMKSQSDSGVYCWNCHREVPHGMARSLSSTPPQSYPHIPAVGFDTGTTTLGGRKPR